MTSTSWPHIAVVGAGAVGGYFGGMLARAVAHVRLIGRPGHVDAWKRDGLTIDSVHFQERIPVEASTDIAASADAELVLFCVKSPDTEETARQLSRHVRRDALIVSDRNYEVTELSDRFASLERLEVVDALDAFGKPVWRFEIWLGTDYRPASP